jgi:P450-derived glycosyltransferase activator
MHMAVWHDYLWSVGDQGDPYALLLRAPQDPYPLYEQVRARGPLHRSALGTWVTADYFLASRVLRDRRFGVRKTNGQKAIEFMEFDNSMLGLDPPDHTRLRKLTLATLNPRNMERWRARAELYCHELLDQVLAGRREFNFMTAFAQQLPLRIVSDLVGVPESYRPEFFRQSRRMAYLLDGVATVEAAEDVGRAIEEMAEAFRGIIAIRQAEPQDDLVSDLLPALADGRLSMAEMVPLCMFLPLAGTETTVNLIGNATRTLMQHPDQWELVRADPGLAPAVIQETLRYDTPVQQYRRIVQEDLELAGHHLPADSELAICAGAGNRDPAVFADPDRFDITRKPGREVLSFSLGTHFCLGAALARLEAEVALAAVVQRLPTLRQAGPIRRRESFIIRGMLQFPVAVE